MKLAFCMFAACVFKLLYALTAEWFEIEKASVLNNTKSVNIACAILLAFCLFTTCMFRVSEITTFEAVSVHLFEHVCFA